jgi:hypothetical protein
MGDDYREFERDLDTIPSHLRTIMLANVLCNLLDDRAPEACLAARFGNLPRL